MAGSKPRSESLKERSAANNRRCVAVSDDYSMDSAAVTVNNPESETMTFKFGAVVRSEKKSVFSVISDVSGSVAGGIGSFCENVSDMIKEAKGKKEADSIKAEKTQLQKQAEEKEREEFLSGKEKEKEVVGKAVKAKYSVEAAEAAVAPKAFGEVVRKKEPEKQVSSNKAKESSDSGANSVWSKVLSLASANKKAAGIAAACLVVLVCVIFTFSNFTFAYEGTVSGKTVTVKSPEQLAGIVSSINETFKEGYGDGAVLFDAESVGLKKKFVRKGSIMPEEDVANILLASNDNLCEMYVIYADGKALVGVRDEEMAKSVLEGFKSYYTGGDDSVDFTTDKELKYELAMAPASILMSDIDAAVMKLNGGEKQENMYTVEDGDNPWLIARKFDTSVDKILSMNNMSEDDTLDVGDEILVEAFVPVVNVTTTQVVKKEVAIAYETEIVKDNSRYNTWSEITVKGEEGKSEIEEKIIKVNGEVTSREVLSETVISKPVTQIKTVGTKEPPKGIGTGRFISPARGYISSRYGNRSRGFHTGLDIAGSYGSPIVAADDGKVSFVGWSGGYGKLVKIDHQNGYVTYYAHNSSFAVKVGQTVSKGQTIAYMGSTGNSTGNHCHFEIIKNGKTQNPQSYI